MIRVILCLAIIVLCGAVGYGVSGYYIQRKKFFFSYELFLNELKSDIGFGAKKLDEIVYSAINRAGISKDLKTLLNNFMLVIKNGESLNKENLFKTINILNEQERESILSFFKKLGKVDSFSQLEDINKMFVVNGAYLSEAKEDSKKYGTLYIKLGVIIGAFISLLIL